MNAKTAAVALLVASATLGVARLQPKLANQLHQMKSREDVYVLPPPAQLRIMSLGYNAAAVDQLWAQLLVEYGTHHQEKRPFPDLEKYLDAVVGLEPDYAPAFKYADTLIAYRPPRGYEADVRTARAFLERGLKSRPYDPDVWLAYGDFMAFVAPSFLADEAEISQWRLKGAYALERAVDLGATSKRAISAAGILSRAGERDATVRQLKKVLSMTDDPEEIAALDAKLDALRAGEDREIIDRSKRVVDGRHARDMPIASRSLFLLVGPMVDARYCAGPASALEQPRCARHWYDLIPSSRP